MSNLRSVLFPSASCVIRLIMAWGIPALLVVILLIPNLAIYWTLQNKIADHGADGLQIIRAAKFSELLGPYSRFQFHHPGPILFYYMAFAEWLIPCCSGQGAHMLAQLVLNAVILGWISYLCIKFTDQVLSGPIVGLALVVVLGNMGCDVFADTWGPRAILLPFALLCVGGAGFSVGETSALPAMIVGGTFSAQTQVATAPVAFVIASVSSVLFIRNRKKARSWFTRAEIITISLSIFLLVLAWAPPLFEELRYEDGNISRLRDFFMQGAKEANPLSSALRQLCRSSILLCNEIVGPINGSNIWACFFTLLPVICATTGFIAKRRFIKALAGICLLATILSIFMWTRVQGAMHEYIFFYYQVIIALSYSVGIVVLVLRVLDCGLMSRYRHATIVVSLGAIAAGAIVYLVNLQAQFKNSLDRHAYIDELYAAINPHDKLTYKLIWRFESKHHDQWETATGLAYAMRKRGYSCCVSNEWLFLFGRDMAPPNTPEVKPLLLFNANVSGKEIDKIPFNIEKDVISGPTRLLVCEVPPVSLPLVIRHDSSDVYFSGFCAPVKTQRWTGSEQPRIEFFLKGSSGGDKLYEICLALISYEPQEIKLSINGNRLCTLSVEKKRYGWTFRVPERFLNLQGHNTIEIDLPKARYYRGKAEEFSGIGFVELIIRHV